MVYWRVAEALARRGWTRYRLMKESQLAPTVVYRVARRDEPVRRIDGRTLEALCAVLGATPGDLLAYVPGKRRRRSAGKHTKQASRGYLR